MTQPLIDLRSDTVTRPTPAMRSVMAAAEVGDDVFDEDPTVHRLQDRVARYFGMEAALFVPSGTMANQIAIRVHCRPGDELICESTSHVVVWEAGAPAALSGVSCRTIDVPNGLLDVSLLRDKIRPANEHYARSRLVCLENTHNRGGGSVYALKDVQAIREWTTANNLRLHLDGARIWNAIVASGVPGYEWGRHVDSISVCFSKGLGAPVGSCIVGSKEFIHEARRSRKLFGGAMRQVGILAAAALYALEHHVDRLAEDHANARILADAIADVPGLTLDPKSAPTNLVWFDVDPSLGSARDVLEILRQHGVLLSSTAPQTGRAVTHLDVSANDCRRAAETIRSVFRSGESVRGAASRSLPGSD